MPDLAVPHHAVGKAHVATARAQSRVGVGLDKRAKARRVRARHGVRWRVRRETPSIEHAEDDRAIERLTCVAQANARTTAAGEVEEILARQTEDCVVARNLPIGEPDELLELGQPGAAHMQTAERCKRRDVHLPFVPLRISQTLVGDDVPAAEMKKDRRDCGDDNAQGRAVANDDRHQKSEERPDPIRRTPGALGEKRTVDRGHEQKRQKANHAALAPPGRASDDQRQDHEERPDPKEVDLRLVRIVAEKEAVFAPGERHGDQPRRAAEGKAGDAEDQPPPEIGIVVDGQLIGQGWKASRRGVLDRPSIVVSDTGGCSEQRERSRDGDGYSGQRAPSSQDEKRNRHGC